MATAKEIIGAFGGPAAASRITGVTTAAIQLWLKSNRIPWWHHPRIEAAANREGIDLPKGWKIDLVRKDDTA